LAAADADSDTGAISVADTSPVTTPLYAVVGPTASGKSDLGIALALRFKGEIINCDSIQVYRGINIATAKVPRAEQQGIPHHLIDIVDPTVTFTAVAWADAARQKIAEIESRGSRAFLVGGTGFYLKALATRFCDTSEIDGRLRGRLNRIAAGRDAGHLHRMLTRVDPRLAATYAVRDTFRILRALEVYFSSRIPLSVWQERTPRTVTAEGSRLRYLVLEPPREQLYERINRRADEMVARGLLEEVEQLMANGLPHDAKAFSAHGYRRIVEFLRGSRSLESAIEQMKLDTRHYAKRQWTWWRKQSETHWLKGFGFEKGIQEEAAMIVDKGM
jgi:tRNA dimethylallyltransferase